MFKLILLSKPDLEDNLSLLPILLHVRAVPASDLNLIVCVFYLN